MKLIGITGGVGAGKSAILSYLQENYNCRVELADLIAHKVKEPGQPWPRMQPRLRMLIPS